MPLTPGDVLQNRYRIAALLGQGGMGAVYRALDLRLSVPMALKEMTPQPDLDAALLAQLRQQFEQEAVTLARLSHPHLVRVTDFFEERGNAYLVMEFIEGESLADRIAREGRLPEAQVVSCAQQLLDALAYCHSRGIVHRDIKPQNILLRPDGRAALVDFGLVKLWNPNDPLTRTVLRGMGTPEYAPPEQYGKQGQTTDPRSDIYSLGATLYHALTGQSPPTASDRIADPYLFQPVRALNPGVSLTTEIAILGALEPARDERWPSASVMAAAFTGAVNQKDARRAATPAPQAAHRPASPGRGPGTAVMAPSASRKSLAPWAWAAGAVIVLLLLGWNALGRATPATPTVIAQTTATATPTPIPTATESPTPTVTTTATPEVTATPAPPHDAQLGDTWTRPADGMVMVYVPAGEFRMGSTEGDDDEKPVHTVALDAFWIDRTEVTNAQYGMCVATGTCTVSEYAGDARFNDASQPVVGVSWHDAVAYCEWAEDRLPTEAEWEYAARGPEGREYPWGNNSPTCRLAQYGECDNEQALAVGSLPNGVSWVGTLDMAGNVWEWVQDRQGDYPSSALTNPTGPSSGRDRIVRGGSWRYGERFLRSADRHWLTPSSTYSFGGFRCASPQSP